ncbi:endolytic transglycosylase MltG [Bacillus benzoevorans]|uniref:Beta-lactam-binding protein with PASTA domain n=1 Tax=Bacillus benzoevorans TaxID=1456 RepID=A0A7X0HSN6_9BACI|nr:endolytic transglycosylase MltG [Bacillus benzoevorans]MBB6446103.1 beta-lactam-binding protein with PASTA domain [Bacillus benzoevorans]
MITPAVLRSFAGGLIVAAGILGIVYLSGGSGDGTTVKKMSEEDMKTELAEKGYVIHTEKEWQQQEDVVASAKADAEKAAKEAANAKKANTKEKTEPAAPAAEQKVVYKTVVNVSSGMTSIDVGRTLETAKIIPSALEFSQEVERRGLSGNLRPGIFEIESGMTTDQIIGIIFH